MCMNLHYYTHKNVSVPVFTYLLVLDMAQLSKQVNTGTLIQSGRDDPIDINFGFE